MHLAQPATSERRLRRAVRIAMLSFALGSAGAAPLAVAAEPAGAASSAGARAYKLAPGPLGRVLSGVAAGGGIALSFDPALAQGMNSPALEGSYTPRVALERLLAGSGLALIARADGSLALAKAAPVSAPAALPAPAPARPAAAAPAAPVATMAQVEVTGQGNGDNPDDPRNGAYSRGATRLNMSLRDTPQAVSVVSRQRIEDQRLETLQDVVGQTTGITLDHASSSRETDQLYSRGFAIDTYLLDGMPTSRLIEPTGFDTAIYERIEVLRGASGLVSGSGSPAAAVNLVRKRPTRELRAQAEAQAGTWNRYRAQADISGPLTEDKRVRGRVLAAHQDQESFVDRYAQKKDLFYGVLEADLGAATRLSAGLSYQKERLDGASRMFPAFYDDGRPTALPRSTNSAARYTYYDRTQSLAFATLEQFFDNDWSAKLALNHVENSYDAIQGYAMRGYLNQATGAGLSLWLSKWDSKPVQNSVDLYASGPFTAFGRKHEAVFGLSAARVKTFGPSYPSWVLPGYDASVPNFYTWNGNSPTPQYDGKIVGSALEQEEQQAAYGTLRLRPADSLSVILGARVSNWKRDTEYVEFGAPTLTDNFRENGKFTPYAGVVLELDRHWSAYASYTSIFSPQTYRDRNNGLLDPLEGNNIELGVKGAFYGGLLNTSASVFHLRQDNLAEMDPDMFWVPGTGGGSYAYHTVQGATSRGFELEVNGQVRPGWQVTAGYAHARVEDSTGKRLQTGQPLNNVKLWTTYELAGTAQGLTVGGGVNWQSTVYQDGAGPNGERSGQDGYALVSLMARYRFSPALSATLNVNNLLDKHYYSSASGGFYGDPRNLMLSLNYRFH